MLFLTKGLSNNAETLRKRAGKSIPIKGRILFAVCLLNKRIDLMWNGEMPKKQWKKRNEWLFKFRYVIKQWTF